MNLALILDHILGDIQGKEVMVFTSVFLGDEGHFKLHARPVLSTVDWVTTQINSPQYFSLEGILTDLLF